MLYHELERYADILHTVKDDYSNFSNDLIVGIIKEYKQAICRDNDLGIRFLIANAVRKYRCLPYPA